MTGQWHGGGDSVCWLNTCCNRHMQAQASYLQLPAAAHCSQKLQSQISTPHPNSHPSLLPPLPQGDLARLWDETQLGGGVVAGVARSCKIHMSQLYDFKKELVRGSMEKTQCYINAGVYIMDLLQYREVRGGYSGRTERRHRVECAECNYQLLPGCLAHGRGLPCCSLPTVTLRVCSCCARCARMCAAGHPAAHRGPDPHALPGAALDTGARALKTQLTGCTFPTNTSCTHSMPSAGSVLIYIQPPRSSVASPAVHASPTCRLRPPRMHAPPRSTNLCDSRAPPPSRLQGVQQPSFVLAIVKHSVDIDSRWNTDSLGYNPRKKRLPPCTLRSGYVLHWNGVYKPWLCAEGADCYQAYWEPYRLED